MSRIRACDFRGISRSHEPRPFGGRAQTAFVDVDAKVLLDLFKYSIQSWPHFWFFTPQLERYQ